MGMVYCVQLHEFTGSKLFTQAVGPLIHIFVRSTKKCGSRIKQREKAHRRNL